MSLTAEVIFSLFITSFFLHFFLHVLDGGGNLLFGLLGSFFSIKLILKGINSVHGFLAGVGTTTHSVAIAATAWAGAAVSAWAALSSAINIGEFTLVIGCGDLAGVFKNVADETGFGSGNDQTKCK